MDWRGRTVLLTGASRGLGEALAVELGRAGARLALVAREERALTRVVRAVREAGGEAHPVPGDVSNADAAARIAGVATALLGSIEVVIHNASSLGPAQLHRQGLAQPPARAGEQHRASSPIHRTSSLPRRSTGPGPAD